VEEVKQLLPRNRALKPRTYRIGANRTIFIGGVCRIDIKEFNYGTIYITVWASDLIPLHLSKTVDNKHMSEDDQFQTKADELWHTHAGSKLNPPGPYTKHLVPKLVPVEVRILLLLFFRFLCLGVARMSRLPCAMLRAVREHSRVQ
jgi:hypothetical protein